MCVTQRLLIDFPIGIFTAFKYEKHTITPEPKPPEGQLYHCAEVYKTEDFAYDCFKIYLLHKLTLPDIVLTNLYHHYQTEIVFDKTLFLMEGSIRRTVL